MKRYLAYVILLLLLASCGAESGRFRIEGRLANMNQAEFYIYNMDGGSLRLDTIKVVDGRFIYETDLEHQGTFVILYPNFFALLPVVILIIMLSIRKETVNKLVSAERKKDEGL